MVFLKKKTCCVTIVPYFSIISLPFLLAHRGIGNLLILKTETLSCTQERARTVFKHRL